MSSKNKQKRIRRIISESIDDDEASSHTIQHTELTRNSSDGRLRATYITETDTSPQRKRPRLDQGISDLQHRDSVDTLHTQPENHASRSNRDRTLPGKDADEGGRNQVCIGALRCRFDF
jgi:hypothetical protein